MKDIDADRASASAEAEPPAGEPGRVEPGIEQWLSDDPPWDPEVLEHIDELAWRLGDLRTGFGTR
jgi:hypothetical protein